MIGKFDFESFSEGGFIWDPLLNKWRPIPETTGKPGLPTIGVRAYAEHPSTEALCLAYNIGQERFWAPTLPPPKDLFQFIADGGILEAVNSFFEFNMWNYCCVPKLGWPPLPIEQTRDTAAKARHYGLPGGLDKLAKALDTVEQKDKVGERLIKKFSIPHQPSKKDPRKRILIEEEPVDGGLFYDYCAQDVRTEAAVSAMLPELPPHELEIWKVDQQINKRGVAIDTQAMKDCLKIVALAEHKYNTELVTLTGGAVQSHAELAKLGNWLSLNGLEMPNMQKKTIETTLEEIPPHPPGGVYPARRALEIRVQLNSASVKKLRAIKRQLASDGRLHGLYSYCGAQKTGRWSGNGPQPQNLKASGSDSVADWNLDAIEAALEAISHGSLEYLEAVYGDPLATVGGCIRGLFVAGPGMDLMCSDYSAIEAVCLAALAGEEWRLEVFRTHGKIYEMSASKISGIPFEEFLEYPEKNSGANHPLRKKIGKVAELACFGAGTQVLTKAGYKSIEKIDEHDLLWDGVEWIRSKGAINKKKRKTIKLDGVRITPDHPVNIGSFWKPAKSLVSNKSIRTQARANALENLSSSTWNESTALEKLMWCACAGKVPTKWNLQTYILGKPPGAQNVQGKKPQRHTKKNTRIMRTFARTLNTAKDLSTGCGPQLAGVTGQLTAALKTMADGASKFVTFGGGQKVPGTFLFTFKRLKGGTIQSLKWIESMWTGTMNPGISGLSQDEKTNLINEKFKTWKTESGNLKIVYDIAHAGPRNRFTIKTSKGHLIVHNSGYQGWMGAWKAFGADKHFTDDRELKKAILKWRAESPAIVEYWGDQYRRIGTSWDFYPERYGVEGAVVNALETPFTWFPVRTVAFYYRKDLDVLFCKLPNGGHLHYHQPRLVPTIHRLAKLPSFKITHMGWNSDSDRGPVGWIRMDAWGGKFVENITQRAARDIFGAALVRLERAGYPVVLHSHDEPVCEVPEGFGHISVLERILTSKPQWCRDWPIKVGGSWRGKRYFKG